jgi:mono/diheme cytochrome c family protein
MKKEEEKSYVVLFMLLSFILAATNAGAIWNEVMGKRPWKGYQSSFHELEYEKAKEKYEDAVASFGQSDKQYIYKAIEKKLNEAREEFERPSTQYKYNKALEELHALDKDELAPLKFESIVIRNEMLEEEYLYGKYKREESKKKIEEMDKRKNELAEKIKHIEEKRSRLQKEIDGFKSKITRYTKELDVHSSNMLEYKETMVKLESRRPQLQVYQVHLEELNEVDRCMSCHVGINKKESVSDEQPYSSHPRRDVYLGNHPPEQFGCALCHEGQARATTSPKEAHGEVGYWLEPMNRGKMAQSSCIKCHDKGEELEGGEELWKGIKLFEELGCFGCHATEGFGGDENRMIGPDLTEIGSKVNPGWLVSWLKGPKDFRASTRMPDFKIEKEEAESIAAYIWQNSGDISVENEREFNEEMIEEGGYIFEDVGCLACHSDEGDSGRTHGPNLARIGEKMNYEYLVSWLLDPKKHQPKTRMPNFRLDENDAKLLATYLMSLKSEEYEKLTEEAGWLNDSRIAKRGENLISRYGCFGCHEMRGMEGKTNIGVELSEVGSKHIHLFDFGLSEKKLLHEVGLKNSHENIGEARRAWLRAKLADPRQFDEGRYKRPEDRLRMPNFNLTEDEIEALSILLTGMREGEIPGSYAYKLTEKQRYLAEGKKAVEKYNCMGCHQFTIDKLYMEDGTELKGMVKLEEEDSLYFQLWEDNDKLGRKAGETAQIMKGRIKSRKMSVGGGIAASIIDYHVEEEGRVPEEAKVFTPPVLYGEGKKVQSEWLFKFLNRPIDLRPWLDVKMPTFKFSGNEASHIVRYFATMDEQEYPYEFHKETDKGYIEEKEMENPGYLAKARNLFESRDINCESCHVRGDITPDGDPSDWAPDLSLASKRLKPTWIVRWLLNPQLIQPGTKMPSFFREGEFQDILSGTPEEQAEAIKDLLMNFPQDMLISEEPDKSVKNTLKSSAGTTKRS